MELDTLSNKQSFCPLPFSEQQIYLIIHCPYFSFVQLIIIYITNRAQERSLWGGCSNAK